MNDSKRSLRVALLGAACFLGLLGVALAADYLGKGHFASGSLDWSLAGTTDKKYTDAASKGMSTWDKDTDLALTETNSGAEVVFSVKSHGDTGWTGFAEICDTSNDCSGAALDNTYGSCLVRINSFYLDNNSAAERQNTFMHEAGHCFSLAHRTDSTSIMLPHQTSIVTPDAKDKQLIDDRY